MISDRSIKALIGKYFAGVLSDEEAVRLAAWVRLSPQNAEDFRAELQQLSAKGAATAEAVGFWHKLSKSINLRQPTKGLTSAAVRYAGVATAIAAAVVIFAFAVRDKSDILPELTLSGDSIAMFTGSRMAQEPTELVYRAPEEHHRKIELSDGTTVVLNSGSTLTVDEKFNLTERKV